jgi:hypothetical protein
MRSTVPCSLNNSVVSFFPKMSPVDLLATTPPVTHCRLSSLHLVLYVSGFTRYPYDYKHRGPGFDSRALLRIFLRELGLERGPLSLVIG